MMPVYDPATDGNRFDWIVAAAARVREERQAEADYVRFQQGLVRQANSARLRAREARPGARKAMSITI